MTQRARELLGSFRARSIFFQAKVLVLACYVCLAVTTVVSLANPRASNALGARVLLLPGDEVVGDYLVIENASRNHWPKVVFEIDGGFQVQRDWVKAGEKVTLYVRDFRKRVVRKRRGRMIPKLEYAPASTKARALRIQTGAGTAVVELHGGATGASSS